MNLQSDFGSHFMEVRAIASPEVSVNDILSKIFFRVHGALAKLECSDVAVSFPDLSGSDLGSVLRIHGSEDSLKRIRDMDARGRTSVFFRMFDYIVLYPVRPVPQDVTQFRSFFRVRPSGIFSPSRARRSLMRSQGRGEDVSSSCVLREPVRKHSVLFITTVSGGGKKFPFFIGHSPVYKTFVPGRFTSYGLSSSVSGDDKIARIPWFPAIV